MNLNATLLVQIAVFAALWWFVAKYVWPPITSAMDERSKRIADGLDVEAIDAAIEAAKRDPRRYPGEKAGSEIETRWLQAQVEEFKPDLIISVHAPYNLLDYDGPVPKPLRFGRLTLVQLGVYPGSMGNYFGVFKQISLVTIELPNATTMPSQKDQMEMWQDMLKWIKSEKR